MSITLSQLRVAHFPKRDQRTVRIPLPDGGSLHLAPLSRPRADLDKLLDDWTPLALDAARLWYSRDLLALLVATTHQVLLFQYHHGASLDAHIRHLEEEIVFDNAPHCGCAGKGWEVFNADPYAGELGDVQRCDECARFPFDEDAQDAARFTGLLVGLDGKVLSEPEGIFPSIARQQAMNQILRARFAEAGRLLGSTVSACFYVLADRVYCDSSTTQLQYAGRLADFGKKLARGTVPGFRRA